jgi:hypothetical protein
MYDHELAVGYKGQRLEVCRDVTMRTKCWFHHLCHGTLGSVPGNSGSVYDTCSCNDSLLINGLWLRETVQGITSTKIEEYRARVVRVKEYEIL